MDRNENFCENLKRKNSNFSYFDFMRNFMGIGSFFGALETNLMVAGIFKKMYRWLSIRGLRTTKSFDLSLRGLDEPSTLVPSPFCRFVVDSRIHSCCLLFFRFLAVLTQRLTHREAHTYEDVRWRVFDERVKWGASRGGEGEQAAGKGKGWRGIRALRGR